MPRAFFRRIVEPPRKWGWPSSAKRGYFEGKVAGSRFKIHRVAGYQNSFLPIIEGNFRRDGLANDRDPEHAIGMAGRARLDRHHNFPGVEFSERRFTGGRSLRRANGGDRDDALHLSGRDRAVRDRVANRDEAPAGAAALGTAPLHPERGNRSSRRVRDWRRRAAQSGLQPQLRAAAIAPAAACASLCCCARASLSVSLTLAARAPQRSA